MTWSLQGPSSSSTPAHHSGYNGRDVDRRHQARLEHRRRRARRAARGRGRRRLRRGRATARRGRRRRDGHLRRDRARDAPDGPAGPARRRWTSCRPRRPSARASSTAPTTRCSQARACRSAQVLLTFFDMSARTHYLNARHTLQQAARLAGRAGDQRERHDDDRRDHVRRQRLPGGPGGDPARRRPAGAAHRHRRPLHAPTRASDPGRRADPGGAAVRASSRSSRSASPPRRSARAGCARRWWRPRWRPRRASPR